MAVQNQLNFLIEQFVYYTGKSFGEKNFFKFATNLDSLTMEDTNTTGQDRLVRASFQIVVHGYLLPKEVASEGTTKRVITPNRVTFDTEVSRDIDGAFKENQKIYNDNPFRSLNYNDKDAQEDLVRRLRDDP